MKHAPITPNLRVSETDDGFLITADSRKPAPEFASLLHRLAHPGPYGGSTNQAYMRACDQIDAAFKIKPVPLDAPHWQGHEHEAVPTLRVVDHGDGRGSAAA